MATRLRRCINKCIKIFLDKTDEDDEDEDYHTPVLMQTEKKYRPRRAATSRAMDTIRGAFDDDKFDEVVSYESIISMQGVILAGCCFLNCSVFKWSVLNHEINSTKYLL